MNRSGYFSIKSIDIDGNRVYLELSKDGAVVDSKAISPSFDYAGMKDKTYYYKKDIGDSKEVVIIAVDNEENEIILNKNKDISLMPGISIKTANSDELRYYPNKEVTEPGTYELRGSVATDTYTWTADNFAGFYYDIDNNIKTEELTATVSEGKKLFEPDGITYTTREIAEVFKYSDWGMYNAVGFLGKKYFAGYIQNYSAGTSPDLLDGANAVNLLDSGILTEILIDEGQEIVQDMSRAVDLKEGYSLKLTIASDKKGVLVELLRDKEVVDKKAVILPGTYVCASNIDNVAGVPLIAARLDEPVFLDSESYFKVNAIWQISEYPIRVSEDTQYGIMTCYHVDSADGVISLNNEANDVTLSKNKHITFMPGFALRTADSDDDALRYYLLKEVEITYSKDKTGSLGGMR